ncbi:hypothetical protein [Thermococcus nautili]|uniref:Uncharacterized protein n=1 Tax=Thermococcus nautili TaxID=195522 RepID=W8P7Q8_9EURY|nr:hypothetical protein [Thermococcus nautili]AHL23600.1 hypothetical protein BD01_2002 [Thermococcus nautili]CAI1492328.1 conserved protein of unknown function [Thermococcus nautili]
MTEEKKNLLKEAYQFGYFVGFRGHSEWAEWVRQKREELYQRAEELGIYELVKDAYRRGKELGKRDREEKLYESLVAKVEREEAKPRPKRAVSVVASARPEESSELEREYVEFLQSTKLTMPPELLDTLKHLEPPKMLRLGD